MDCVDRNISNMWEKYKMEAHHIITPGKLTFWTPQNVGLVQMIFLFNWGDFSFQPLSSRVSISLLARWESEEILAAKMMVIFGGQKPGYKWYKYGRKGPRLGEMMELWWNFTKKVVERTFGVNFWSDDPPFGWSRKGVSLKSQSSQNLFRFSSSKIYIA